MNAADATVVTTLKKPTGELTDDTSEKEIEAEAFKKPPDKLSADTSDNEPFKKPLPPSRLTGKKEVSRKS